MKVKFTATFSGFIEIDEEDERFLQPKEDSDGIETEEFEPFSPTFALAVLQADFDEDPFPIIEYSDTNDIHWEEASK